MLYRSGWPAAAITLAAASAMAQTSGQDGYALSPSTQVPAATIDQSTTGTTSESRSGSAVANLVDINAASREELNSLPGIGEERTEAIIRNRPYTSPNELVEKGIVPKNIYDQINDRMVAR